MRDKWRVCQIILLQLLVALASLNECSCANVSVVISTPDTTVNASSTVLMVCVAHGDPAPVITWKKETTAITNCTSDRHSVYERVVPTQYNRSFTESVLEICSADTEDSGGYLCTASNGVTSATANNATNLTVIPEPFDLAIVITTPNETLRARSTVMLVCVALGSPVTPTVRWQFNGTSIISNSTSCRHTVHERVIPNQGRFVFVESILEICNVDPADTGEYLCTASYGDTTVSATNATVVTVLKDEVPPQPDNCRSVPVYNSDGDLTAINFTWSRVGAPEQALPRSSVDLNVTQYIVSMDGLGVHSNIPVDYACPEDEADTCSYSYTIQLSRTARQLLQGHIAAESEAGRGPVCSPLPVQLNNPAVSQRFLSVTAKGSSTTLECSQFISPSPSTEQTAECEVCYGPRPSACDPRSLSSDEGPSLTCTVVPIGSSKTIDLSPPGGSATYCYRAIAKVNGYPRAAIHDTFSLSTCQESESTGVQAATVLPLSVSVSAIVALIIGLLLGFLVGTCCLYICRNRRKPRQPSLLHRTQRDDLIVTNTAKVTDEEPMYEDVDALQKKKKDFEDYELTTSMNDAYIAMDPDKNDDLYDND